VAETYGVSPSWVRRLKQRRRELGTIAPLPPRYGRKPKFTPADLQRLADLVAEQPDATLAELKERLGLDVTLKSICVRLQQMKLRVKKKSSTPRSRTAPTSRRCGDTGTSSSRA